MPDKKSSNVPRNERLRGIGSMLAAVFVFAIMDASLKRLSTQCGMLQVGAMRCLASWLFVALPLALRRDWRSLRPGRGAFGAVGALGQYWITDAFRRAPPSVVGPFEYTSMIWVFAIDWVFWWATPTRGLLLGAGLVIASGVFVIVDEHRLTQLALSPSSPPP
jgi:drug/metabolite transporter (DMT)-like permease